MDSRNIAAASSFGRLLLESLPKVPWKDFVLGLLIPLTLLWTLTLRPVPAGWPSVGTLAAMAWCVGLLLVQGVRRQRPCAMAALCFLLVAAQYAMTAYAARHASSDWLRPWVPGISNAVVALLFLGSLLTARPLVLLLLNKETVSAVSEALRQGPRHAVVWRRITLVWGLAYVVQAALLTLLRHAHSPWEPAVAFFFGWPLLLVLLLLSVTYPHWSWK